MANLTDFYPPPVSGGGGGQEIFDCIVDVNGGGDYTTLEDAWTAGHRYIGVMPGANVISGGGLHLDFDSTLPDKKVGLVGIGAGVEVLLTTDTNIGLFSNYVYTAAGISGSETLSTTYGSPIVTTSDGDFTTMVDGQGNPLSVGMWFSESFGFDHYKGWTAKVKSIDNATQLTLDRPARYTGAPFWGFQWAIEAPEIRNINIGCVGSATQIFMLDAEGFGCYNMILDNVGSEVQNGSQVQLRVAQYGSGRHSGMIMTRCRGTIEKPFLLTGYYAEIHNNELVEVYDVDNSHIYNNKMTETLGYVPTDCVVENNFYLERAETTALGIDGGIARNNRNADYDLITDS